MFEIIKRKSAYLSVLCKCSTDINKEQVLIKLVWFISQLCNETTIAWNFFAVMPQRIHLRQNLDFFNYFSRNMLIAPHPENLYETEVFPGILFAYRQGQVTGDWSGVGIQQSRLAVATRQASNNLQSIMTVLQSLQ